MTDSLSLPFQMDILVDLEIEMKFYNVVKRKLFLGVEGGLKLERVPFFWWTVRLWIHKTGHFHFQTKKILSQTKLLVAILYFCQKPVFWLWGPLARPPNIIFLQKISQKLCWTFVGKVKPYNHHLSIKNIEKIPFKKAEGGICSPPGLIGLKKFGWT